MKKFLKYLALGLFTLLLVIVVGLLMYYESLRQDTPFPQNIAQASPVGLPSLRSGKPVILPVPRSVTWKSGSFTIPKTLRFQSLKDEQEAIGKICENRLQPVEISADPRGAISFVKVAGKTPQSYHLTITPQRIAIEYGDLQGAFHAMTTLKLIIAQSGPQLPCVDIDDQPDLATRGAMLDISRGKVPKLETLYRMVDFLADLKYNQLQLYIEGFSFAYPSYPQYWQNETPLLPEEIRALDQYCKDRYIELVPNQNSLGHMQDWLKQEEFASLAECPNGYKLFGLINMKTTLSPANEASLELVKKMSLDLLPNFTSTQFNVNLDEPFELGKCGDKPLSTQEVAQQYVGYVKRLNEFVNSQGKTMQMWGDVISRSPEVIADLPKNITLLEWRYESLQSFKEICEQYQQAELRYMVCPGTSSWSSYTGRTDNMLGNIEDAVTSGIRFGASGILITDWGDTPHQQYLPVSYAGLAYAAALGWHNAPRQEVPLADYLSFMVFKDSSGVMGNLALDMGRYNQFEEYPMMAMTTTNMATRFGMIDKVMSDAIQLRLQRGIVEIAPFDSLMIKRISDMFASPGLYQADAILMYLDSLNHKLSTVDLGSTDSADVKAEYRNALRMVRAATLMKKYNLYHLHLPDDQNRAMLLEIKSLCSALIPEHERLWLSRNKKGGFNGSIEGFVTLQADAEARLQQLESGSVSRWARRTLEKLVAAGVAWYVS